MIINRLFTKLFIKTPIFSVFILLLLGWLLYYSSTTNQAIIYTKIIGSIENDIIKGNITEWGSLTSDRNFPAIWYVSEQGRRYSADYNISEGLNEEFEVLIFPLYKDLISENLVDIRNNQSHTLTIEIPNEKQSLWKKLIRGM